MVNCLVVRSRDPNNGSQAPPAALDVDDHAWIRTFSGGGAKLLLVSESVDGSRQWFVVPWRGKREEAIEMGSPDLLLLRSVLSDGEP